MMEKIFRNCRTALTGPESLEMPGQVPESADRQDEHAEAVRAVLSSGRRSLLTAYPFLCFALQE